MACMQIVHSFYQITITATAPGLRSCMNLHKLQLKYLRLSQTYVIYSSIISYFVLVTPAMARLKIVLNLSCSKVSAQHYALLYKLI